jgi:hypothetical protein
MYGRLERMWKEVVMVELKDSRNLPGGTEERPGRTSVAIACVTAEHVPNASVFFIEIVGGGVQLGPLGTAATHRPIVPTPHNYNDGEIAGMLIGRGNRSTQRKPAPVLLCPPQTPHAARTRTRASAVGSQRLTA